MSVDIGGQSDQEVDGPAAGAVFLFPDPDAAVVGATVDVTVAVSTPGLVTRVLTKAVRVDDLQAGAVSVKFI